MLAVSLSSQANFHLWYISEVYSNSDGTVQFIELTAFPLSSGQQFLFSNFGGPATISSGSNTFAFPNDLPGNTTNKKFLIGTVGYSALPGVPAPDYTVQNGFVFTNNASVNFSGGDSLGYVGGSIPTDGIN